MTTTTEPIYFWRTSEVPYGFMSQWYRSPFEVDGIVYETAEMWMMIQKAKLFGGEETVKKMTRTKDPREHQRLGRKAKGFDAEKWDANKSRIVEEGSYHKFTRGPEAAAMRKTLLDTGDRELVEASPRDAVWGIGYDAKNAELNREHWGENRLGLALMVTRDRLRKEATGL